MARGSIKPYGPPEDGRYRVRVYVGVDPVTGGDRYRTEVVTGLRAAEDRLAEFLAAAAGRTPVALRNALWRARECCARPMGVCLDPQLFDGTG